MTLLAVADLAAGYGRALALHGVSLQVEAGEIVALLGANGAGKTTLMRTLAGVVEARGGTIALDGQALTALPAAARVDRGLAMVPEGRLLFPGLTVEENLRIGAYAPRVRAGGAAALAEIYELFPKLAERRRQLAGTLSGGEQQMVAIGRGLMARPRLLLLDEPTLGLAPVMADMVFELVPRLRRSGLTILIAEQDAPRTLDIADRAYVIENGLLTLAGPAAALARDARVRAAYLGMGEEEAT
jgi:branched-chain amino acid transport system ATP-binding protein